MVSIFNEGKNQVKKSSAYLEHQINSVQKVKNPFSYYPIEIFVTYLGWCIIRQLQFQKIIISGNKFIIAEFDICNGGQNEIYDST